MKINFTTEHKVLLNILFEDIIQEAYNANDKKSVKKANKIKDKFSLNSLTSDMKPSEIKLLSDMLLHSIKVTSQTGSEKLTEEQRSIKLDNLNIMVQLREFIHEKTNL